MDHAVPTALPSMGHAVPTALLSMDHAVPTALPSMDHAVPTAILSLGHAVPTALPSMGHAVSTGLPSLGRAVPTALQSMCHAVPTALPSIGHAVPTSLLLIGHAFHTSLPSMGQAVRRHRVHLDLWSGTIGALLPVFLVHQCNPSPQKIAMLSPLSDIFLQHIKNYTRHRSLPHDQAQVLLLNQRFPCVRLHQECFHGQSPHCQVIWLQQLLRRARTDSNNTASQIMMKIWRT